MEFIENQKRLAAQNKKTIVLPEGEEERNIKAADKVLAEGFANITLIGNPEVINQKVAEYGLKNICKATIVDPKNHAKKADYANILFELRKSKGMTIEKATALAEDPLYLGCLLIKAGDGDGEVSGAIHATGDVLRPAFQIIKTKPGISVVSAAFIMLMKDDCPYADNGTLVFADCAVNPNPTAAELAEIAVTTGRTTKVLTGLEPRIAMLSFSTKGSASHDMVTKVAEATKLAQEKAPDLAIDGELQSDAALVESVGQLKAPGSKIAGKANVLVFPSLEAGNIAYKLVQRLAGAEAIGPILQGIAAPVNDLSRGCSVDDIVGVIAITANQANGAN